MAPASRWSLSDPQTFTVGVLIVAGIFILACGGGMANIAVAGLGVAVAVLGPLLIIMTGLRGGGREVTYGTAHVHLVSPLPTSGTTGRCELELLVNAHGINGVPVRIRDPAVPVSKWPDVGATLPVMVSVRDPRETQVLWDEVRTHREVEFDRTDADAEDLPADDADYLGPTEPIDQQAPDHPAATDDDPYAGDTPHQVHPDDADYLGDTPDVDNAPYADDEYYTDAPEPMTAKVDEPDEPDEIAEAPAPAPTGSDDDLNDLIGRPLPGQRQPGPYPRAADPGPDPTEAPVPAAVATATGPAEAAAAPATTTGGGVSVTLIVSDLPRSLRFYRDQLGLREDDSSRTTAVLSFGDARVILRQVADMPPIDRRLVHLNLDVPDVQEAYDRLRDQGIDFVHRPRVVQQGEHLELCSATFRDPDGHAIAITRWMVRH